jgi:hypothetical protein
VPVAVPRESELVDAGRCEARISPKRRAHRGGSRRSRGAWAGGGASGSGRGASTNTVPARDMPDEAAVCAACSGAARTALGDEAFDAAWAYGYSIGDERAVGLALGSVARA